MKCSKIVKNLHLNFPEHEVRSLNFLFYLTNIQNIFCITAREQLVNGLIVLALL